MSGEREDDENPILSVKDKAPELRRFGFNGVRFPASYNEENRRDFVKGLSKSFFNLAKLTGLPEESMSLGGRISLSVDTENSIDCPSLANFDSKQDVINLSTLPGYEGALAHEWFHALDNRLAEEMGFRDGVVLSELGLLDEAKKVPLLDRGGAILSSFIKTIREEKKRLKEMIPIWEKANKKIMDYEDKKDILDVAEISANAFELFVFDRLRELGIKDPLLVSEPSNRGILFNNNEERELVNSKFADSFKRLLLVSPYATQPSLANGTEAPEGGEQDDEQNNDNENEQEDEDGEDTSWLNEPLALIGGCHPATKLKGHKTWASTTSRGKTRCRAYIKREKRQCKRDAVNGVFCEKHPRWKGPTVG